MRKNRINLLVSREDYQKYETFFFQLKLVTVILMLILFIIFIFFYQLLRGKFNQYEAMNLQKKTYLQQLLTRTGDEAKINYIQKKYTDMNVFLKEDAASLPYFQLLSDAIKGSSESATLKSFDINKDHSTSFTISFSSFDTLMEFLKFAESEIFVKNFETITLKSFTIIGDKEKKESYQLGFNGKFVPIKVDVYND